QRSVSLLESRLPEPAEFRHLINEAGAARREQAIQSSGWLGMLTLVFAAVALVVLVWLFKDKDPLSKWLSRVAAVIVLLTALVTFAKEAALATKAWKEVFGMRSDTSSPGESAHVEPLNLL